MTKVIITIAKMPLACNASSFAVRVQKRKFQKAAFNESHYMNETFTFDDASQQDPVTSI